MIRLAFTKNITIGIAFVVEVVLKFSDRHAPRDLRPAGLERLDQEDAVELLGALAKVFEPQSRTTDERRLDAYAVVNDLKCHLVSNAERDGEVSGA
jgi:hypothetical protein